MVQPKRKQPPRACRHPALFYSEPDLKELESHYAEGEIKTALVEKKRKRTNRCRQRATSPEQTTQPEPVVVKSPPLKRKKNLWRELDPDLVEIVLSHLPVSSLWHTVMSINPTRWMQILSNNGNTNILSHGNHVDSSIGYIKSYSSTFRLPQEDDHRPPPPRALDHTTQTWQALPRFPESNIICHRLKVQSVSEGLTLMVMPEHWYTYSSSYRFRHFMVTWNPVSHTHRWLTKSPLSYDDPDFLYCTEVLVVDREKTGYRVIEFVESVTALATSSIMHGPRRMHVPYRQDQKGISGYTVYDSASASWGAVQPRPGYISEVRLNSAKTSVSCEGCVCFITVQRQSGSSPGWERPLSIVCYDPSSDVWSEVPFPKNFVTRLLGKHKGCLVKELLYASGKVYMIFTRSTRLQLYTHCIASISLADIQSGIASFEHVGRVKEAEMRNANSKSPHINHPAPKCWQSRPNELILQRPCARECLHRWYMLPVGRMFQLCVVVCGRWHKRFDLDARVWTDVLMEVPCEKEQDQPRLLPSGRIYHNWDTNYHPYIPSWVKV